MIEMMLGDRVLVFSVASIIASVKLIFALLNCGDDDPFALVLTVVVVYLILLDKGGAL